MRHRCKTELLLDTTDSPGPHKFPHSIHCLSSYYGNFCLRETTLSSKNNHVGWASLGQNKRICENDWAEVINCKDFNRINYAGPHSTKPAGYFLLAGWAHNGIMG